VLLTKVDTEGEELIRDYEKLMKTQAEGESKLFKTINFVVAP